MLCMIQIMSAIRAGTCTSLSKNIKSQQLDITSKKYKTSCRGHRKDQASSIFRILKYFLVEF